MKLVNTAANLLAASAAALLLSTAPVHATGNCETIVEIAAGNPDFSILVDAVVAADLLDTLSGNGPFTVFAPTNEAFEDLGDSVLNPLLNRPKNKAALQDILLYHVIPGEIFADDLDDGICVETANGDEVYITLNPAKVNDAKIITTDIEACNGVIHVIDAVLIPPENGRCPRPGKPGPAPAPASKPSPGPGGKKGGKPGNKKDPSPGGYGKKAPSPGGYGKKDPSPGGDGKKEPSPGGYGKKEPSPGGDGKKAPSPGGYGKKDPSPGGDGKKEPSPGGYGKKEPSPGGDGKKEPSPGGYGKKEPSPGGKPGYRL